MKYENLNIVDRYGNTLQQPYLDMARELYDGDNTIPLSENHLWSDSPQGDHFWESVYMGEKPEMPEIPQDKSPTLSAFKEASNSACKRIAEVINQFNSDYGVKVDLSGIYDSDGNVEVKLHVCAGKSV